MNVADELEKLQRLYQSGALNEFEYATAKAKTQVFMVSRVR